MACHSATSVPFFPTQPVKGGGYSTFSVPHNSICEVMEEQRGEFKPAAEVVTDGCVRVSWCGGDSGVTAHLCRGCALWKWGCIVLALLLLQEQNGQRQRCIIVRSECGGMCRFPGTQQDKHTSCKQRKRQGNYISLTLQVFYFRQQNDWQTVL